MYSYYVQFQEGHGLRTDPDPLRFSLMLPNDREAVETAKLLLDIEGEMTPEAFFAKGAKAIINPERKQIFPLPVPRFEIKRYAVSLDPAVDIFHVSFHHDYSSVWVETCKNEDELSMFIRGVRAGWKGHIPEPEIPSQPEPLPREACS